jgi:putative transposase
VTAKPVLVIRRGRWGWVWCVGTTAGGCRRVSDREAMDGILLVLRTGMRWNALKATGVCSSSSAHRRFQEWVEAGVFDEIWRQGLLEYDWSLLREAAGVPVGLAHDGANRHDSKLLELPLASVPIQRPEPTLQQPQGLCLDRGYDFPWVHELATERGLTPHIRGRGAEIKLTLRRPGWRARRWVVEACQSRLNRNRSLLLRWSKNDDNHLALLRLPLRADRVQESSRCPACSQPIGTGPLDGDAGELFD